MHHRMIFFFFLFVCVFVFLSAWILISCFDFCWFLFCFVLFCTCFVLFCFVRVCVCVRVCVFFSFVFSPKFILFNLTGD